MQLKLGNRDLDYGFVALTFFTLSLCFDFIDKIEIFYGIDFIKFNRILKGVFVAYGSFFAIWNFKYVLKKVKFIAVLALFLIAIFFLKIDFFKTYLLEYIRYLFLVLTFPLLHYIFFVQKKQVLIGFYTVLKYTVLVNAVAITLGFAFGIQVFRTYDSFRFGYNGILLSQGFTPYFYLSSTMVFWFLKDKLMLLITLIIALLSGIKGVYFSQCLALFLIIFFNKEWSKWMRIKLASAILMVFVVATVIILNIAPFKQLVESGRLMTAIFSYRIDRSLYDISNLAQDNFNILIGLKEINYRRLELQLVDLFMFFGFAGVLVYSYFIFKLFTIAKHKTLAVIFLTTTILLSILIGNLFYIPLSSFLLVFTLFCLKEKCSLKHNML